MSLSPPVPLLSGSGTTYDVIRNDVIIIKKSIKACHCRFE